MGIADVLVYVGLIAALTIYIHFEKRWNYQKGFQDGVKHYSDMVNDASHEFDFCPHCGADMRVTRESEEDANEK